MLDHENILRLFQDTAERRGEEPCLRFRQAGVWRSLSWVETLEQVKILAEALKKQGIGFYDRVAILATTRYEWTLLDLAILSLGAVTVPIYHSTLYDEALHIMNDSEARVIFVEDSTQLEKILKIRNELSHLEKIVVIQGKVMGEGILTLDEFKTLGIGVPSDFGARIRQISFENLATLVYTSGTTGPPKGVMLTHGNIASEVTAIAKAFPISPSDCSLLFLPLAHILARVMQFVQLAEGFTQAYAESIDKLLDNIREISPHFMVSVPRIFEKIYSKVMTDVQNASGFKKDIFFWSLEVGKQHSGYRLHQQPIPWALQVRYAVAQKLVFSKLHKKLGGRIRFFVSGGAPLGKEIAEFFHAAGLLIMEGYGLTETTAAVNINLPEYLAFGTVGRPMEGIEEKIAPDGEILVKGAEVFQGYWRQPEATAQAFDKDGWFHTGDIGEFDAEGRLRITDRKKDIIVTAGGKNVAPQNIESLLKTHPILSQVVVHGDRRKYLTALITLNQEEIGKKAVKMGIKFDNLADLVHHPRVYDMVKKIIDETNHDLPNYETIKRFAILDKDFSIDSGELTPTLKVKRKVINERYKDILDRLYSE